MPTGAAPAYPAKPVISIVPFSAGGGNDILLRLISKYANKYLGQSLIVENKPGASGQIGWTALSKARPDGYTIGATSFPSMLLIKALRPETAFGHDDFRYICNIQIDPIVWVVRADGELKTAKDIAEFAKANPARLNVAGDGPQSNVQLQHLLAAKTLGFSTNFVPYSGSGPALTALLGGHVDIAVSTVSASMPHIESGKLRAVALFHEQRLDALRDTPTAGEVFGVDIPGVGTAIRGLAAPKGLDSAKVAILEEAIGKICRSPEFIAEASSLGIIVRFMGAAETEDLVRKNYLLVEEYKSLLK